LKDIQQLSPIELLTLHARIEEELRDRNITQTANNPTGDLAEYLFCKAFGWEQSGNSNPNIDIAPDGTRYQIKGRDDTYCCHKNDLIRLERPRARLLVLSRWYPDRECGVRAIRRPLGSVTDDMASTARKQQVCYCRFPVGQADQ
jgi:hypothetical protein